MGGFNSKDPKDLVLVPPLFERDFRGRSRMTRSTYDWMFCKPGLKWLFNDYIRGDEVYSILRFRPVEDPRLSVHARLAARLGEENSTYGRMALRFQPNVDEPLCFADLKAGNRGATLRACYFNAQQNFGAFAAMPVGDFEAGQLGIRFSSPRVSVGCIASQSGSQNIWSVVRSGPFYCGAQLNDLEYATALKDWRSKLPLVNVAFAYAPGSVTPGRGSFTTAVEVVGGEEVVLSLLYHAALQRQCKNPLEDEGVVGITNYLNLGLQMRVRPQKQNPGAIPAGSDDRVDSSMRLAASWQVNKNWLLKSRVGTDEAAVSVAIKAWWQPSMAFALSAVYDFARRAPKLGFTYTLENYGNIRYERSAAGTRLGKALVQRHVALPEDIANMQGKGLMVQKKDLDNKSLLGQQQAASADYL